MSDIPFFPPNPDLPRRIEILVYEDIQLLDLAGPLQAFASCNDFMVEQARPAPYRCRTISLHGGSIRTSAGLEIATERISEREPQADTLVVSGGRGVHQAAKNAALLHLLARRAASARRVASVCTGAFLLAEAGLLEGRRAATHWAYCAELAQRYPGITVESQPIFVEDTGVWTSAGVTAGIDLTLALIEEDLGREIALAIARRLVVFLKRPGGQAQFSTSLDLQQRSARFADLHAWIRAHLKADLRVAVLAERAGMSERSFVRHYNAETGMTPARAVEAFRLEAAQRDLCETSASIKDIARRCGFPSAELLRRAFQRRLGLGPTDYRDRFGLHNSKAGTPPYSSNEEIEPK